MKKREYVVLLQKCGEFDVELYSTRELVIALIISRMKKNFEIIRLRRAYFYE